MGILDLFQNGPYMQNPRPLKNVDWNVFKLATYQIVPSEHGVPMVRLELVFRRPNSQLFTLARGWTFPSSTINPDMTMAVLLDKSGSMSGTFSEGHAYNCCWNILNHLQSADQSLGYDLVFYSDQIFDAGHVNSQPNLNSIIRRTRPSGGTLVTEALKQTIKTHHKKRGLYVLVITDGEFQDKQRVQEYITQSILPQLTLENPYAYRLHFVGAGEGADERFLHQLEAVCSGQGFQLVTSHHHAHLSHSHEGMLDEIDRAYLGPGWDFEIAENGFLDDTADSESTVLRVGNVVTREWSDGPIGRFHFLPRHMVVGLEYKPTHPGTLPVQLRFRDAFDRDRLHEFVFNVPLPKQDEVDTFAHKFVWPVLRQLQGGDSDANLALEKEAQRVHEEEIIRQAKDLESLSRGGIPVSAQERLKELLADKEHLFTSNLSPAELGLMRSKGYKARGIVTGSAIYHIGAAFASVTDCEVRQLTEAYDRATELAVKRMAEELRIIGAHGVIGVRLKLSRHEWGEKTIEVQAVGTAIEAPGPAPATPWLSDLSGQEWWALHRAGYDPVGLVWGHCSWFILTSDKDQQICRSWKNQELTHWSDAFSQARHLALDHVKRRAKESNGTGITGVKLERRLTEVEIARPAGSWDSMYGYKHHNLLVSIIGTSIRPRKDAATKMQGTSHVLSLRDGRLRPAILKQEADFQMLET